LKQIQDYGLFAPVKWISYYSCSFVVGWRVSRCIQGVLNFWRLMPLFHLVTEYWYLKSYHHW
jgi:riboflavin transporter FmnP